MRTRSGLPRATARRPSPPCPRRPAGGRGRAVARSSPRPGRRRRAERSPLAPRTRSVEVAGMRPGYARRQGAGSAPWDDGAWPCASRTTHSSGLPHGSAGRPRRIHRLAVPPPLRLRVHVRCAPRHRGARRVEARARLARCHRLHAHVPRQHLRALDQVGDAEGAVEVTDFMSMGDRRADVVRRVRGISGTVRMQGDLRLRFGYATALPWIRKLDGDDPRLVAVAGPDAVVVRGPSSRPRTTTTASRSRWRPARPSTSRSPGTRRTAASRRRSTWTPPSSTRPSGGSRGPAPSSTPARTRPRSAGRCSCSAR
ncbi:hypothetical protein BC477_19620 [Clavibacter michiganensis subsp. michiganensis]|uniref:Uncharacterized protein n=1 Tax=Clavibacter michiganensis subsp. michiganensis TaxID=33013 RepID=A0A251XCY0_CLAMM|nr:hypothetical protein BC477_19620 [Clavibacter michiganensis subsp. michiganensis]OUD99899.1 hypothetical protein CMMCAS07_19160 [Clavibacter michiganensis subsp. michiganensis]